MQTPSQVLHAHIVDAEVVAGSHGADAVKYIFLPGFAWHRVNDHIRIRQNIVYRIGNFSYHLAGALEGHIAGQPYRKVGKIAVARAAYTDPLHLDYTINPQGSIQDPIAISGG